MHTVDCEVFKKCLERLSRTRTFGFHCVISMEAYAYLIVCSIALAVAEPPATAYAPSASGYSDAGANAISHSASSSGYSQEVVHSAGGYGGGYASAGGYAGGYASASGYGGGHANADGYGGGYASAGADGRSLSYHGASQEVNTNYIGDSEHSSNYESGASASGGGYSSQVALTGYPSHGAGNGYSNQVTGYTSGAASDHIGDFQPSYGTQLGNHEAASVDITHESLQGYSEGHGHSQVVQTEAHAVPISKHVEITKHVPYPVYKQVHVPGKLF